MMNPQYMPPGQNNNAPSNPLGFPPTSQEYNGAQNANIYNQAPLNGPQTKPLDQLDMSQKMQNMNLNGPQGYPNLPPSQLPPGQLPPGANFPAMTNFNTAQFAPGHRPIGALPPGRSLVSGASQQLPPTSGFGMPPTNPALNIDQQQNVPFSQGPPSSASNQGLPKPPSSQPSQPPIGPPMSQPSQMGPPVPQGLPTQLPPHSQPGIQAQQHMGRQPLPPMAQPNPNLTQQQQGVPPSSQPGMPPQLNQSPQPNSLPLHSLPPQNQPGLPSEPRSTFPPSSLPAQPPLSQHNQPSQMGLPPQGIMQPSSQLGPKQPGLPPQSGQVLSQPGFPPQPGLTSHPTQQTQMPRPAGIPSQPGQMIGQSSFPPQPGQPAFSSQSGQMPGPQGMPSQPGQMLNQHGQMPSQPGQMPSQPGAPSQPGLPPQPGQIAQPGLPPQPGQPRLPPQPGGFQTQGAYNQFQSMPGLPHMPPPMSQQRTFQQAGQQFPPASGMPPMANQPLQSQPMPGQINQPGYQQPSSGYPPQYQPPFPGQQPSYPGQPGYQQQPQKKLDPDQMPSPIQVMADDQQNRGGLFVTNEKGGVPPLVTTDFVVDDKGNASPRYMRSSMYSVPVTADLLKQTSIPFCLVISPMAEPVATEPLPPLLDFAALTGSPNMGPVRCSRCKAYMCPNMKFIDAGRHFKCAFCKATTEVPMEYTQYINSMQQYGRVPAEMALGCYEIVATKEYCRNNTLPNPPAIVFVIDVSYNSIKSGLVHTVCNNILDVIESLPKDEQTGQSWTRVGFITYSSTVHFYNCKGTLGQPQMLCVGDVGEMFVPLLEGFLVRAEESGPVLQALLQQLPELFQDSRETETILLPAVQAGLEALKAADTSGQLLVFHTTLPSYNAPGKLINREDRKILGTEKEKQILNPQTTAYNEVGQACAAAGVCVELFVCNNAYVDAATIGQLPRLTGGQLHKYTYFTADIDGPRLKSDISRVVLRPTAHDAVMRVRTSTGVRATDFYGHFFMSNTTDVELAAIDADKAVGIEIKHDDKLTGEDGVYIQTALLYTHRSGQRRLRVLNLALNVAHQLADVYRSMELDTCVNFLTKQAVWALREHSPRVVREGLSARCARSLAAYRKHCASPSSAGQLVLPESMKLLPLYTSCLLRSDALAGGPDITCDDRSCAMYRAMTADVSTSVVYTYPRLLPMHRLGEGATPQPLRASVDKMNDQGVYLLENGVHMLMWVGSQASPEFIRDVFGVTSPQQIDTQVCELPELDNPVSVAVRNVIEDARTKRRSAMRLYIVLQYDKRETLALFRRELKEDQGLDGTASYTEHLLAIHKQIKDML